MLVETRLHVRFSPSPITRPNVDSAIRRHARWTSASCLLGHSDAHTHDAAAVRAEDALVLLVGFDDGHAAVALLRVLLRLEGPQDLVRKSAAKLRSIEWAFT